MNFQIQNPTRLVFGPGVLEQLGGLASSYGRKALLVTGGGSVKKSGAFDQALKSLQNAGIAVIECNGIEPNPRISSVRRGAALARDNQCELVIALGGGSTMDAAKAIAAAFYYEGDPWDMIFHGQPHPHIPEKALPLITVPTLAATGSEMNMGAVISNEETQEKSFMQTPCLYPKVALVDPLLILSVPKNQTAYGVCDIITHVTESYFNGVDGTPIQDRFAESLIATVLEYGPRAVANGNDLEAREQIQWASILALNGWVNVGTNGGFPVHMIEHTLSAFHDITHGAGLSIVNPSWMRFAAKQNPQKFAQFAERLFGIANPDELDCAMQGIERLEAFLKGIGCPTRLHEVGIGPAQIRHYAKETLRVSGSPMLYAKPAMGEEDIVHVLESAL